MVKHPNKAVEFILNQQHQGFSMVDAVRNLVEFLEQMQGISKSEAETKANEAWKLAEAEYNKVLTGRDERSRGAIKLELRPEAKWYTPHLLVSRPCWGTYRQKLEDKGWPSSTISEVDDSTDRIVGLMSNPRLKQCTRKGLVIGRVQSGKTSNFTGVIAKAADAGFSFIVVMAGTTNSLRYQTQTRLHKDLIPENAPEWHWLTLAKKDEDDKVTEGDFDPGHLEAASMLSGNTKLIAIIKKNASVLKRFNRWISSATLPQREMKPMLLIDDECDNASVNTRDPDEDPATINNEIRSIINNMPNATYVGYTATPFANVFINPNSNNNDLYPEDFIYPLSKSPSYFGVERIFGSDPENAESAESGNDMIRTIPKDELNSLRPTGSTADEFQFVPTDTLKEAVAYFLMTCAGRLYREKHFADGRKDFKSMLINTSQKMIEHAGTLPEITKLVASLRASFTEKETAWKAIWEKETTLVDSKNAGCAYECVKWEDLRDLLVNEVLPQGCVKIIVSNSDKNTASNLSQEYMESNRGQMLIVIGGNTLSRGITLEGLCVSYFVRTSKSYDTLLQMGRWFGYRPNYEDMPRVWMTSAMERQFFQLAGVEIDMFKRLESHKAGASPRDVPLLIRSIPGMLITARAKMRHAVAVNIDYSGWAVQTTFFSHKDTGIIEHNIGSVTRMVEKLGGANRFSNNPSFVYKTGVDAETVIAFLKDYKCNESNQEMQTDLIVKYIKDQLKKGGCKEWSFAIKTKAVNVREGEQVEWAGIKLNTLSFAKMSEQASSPETAYLKAIKSSTDIFADFPDYAEVVRNHKDSTEEQRNETRGARKPDVGMIVIYPINGKSKPQQPGSSRVDLDAAGDLVGVTVFMPEVTGDKQSHSLVGVRTEPETTNEDSE